MHVAVVQLGAHFPKPEGPETIIDVSLFEERQLTAVSGDTYPLIVRLECVSDKGKTESHQLKVGHLVIGCMHVGCAVLIYPSWLGGCGQARILSWHRT